MKRRISSWVCIIASVSLGSAAPPGSSGPHVEVLFARTLVVVDQRVVAGAQGLVVPMCDEGGESRRCSLAAHIEVQSGRQWSSAPLSYAAGIPGGIPLDRAKVVKLDPGNSVELRVSFLRRDYVFKAGQQVRLRLDTWLTEEAMRANEPALSVVTSPFALD